MGRLREHVHNAGLLQGPTALMHKNGCVSGQGGRVARNHDHAIRPSAFERPGGVGLAQGLRSLSGWVQKHTVKITLALEPPKVDLE